MQEPRSGAGVVRGRVVRQGASPADNVVGGLPLQVVVLQVMLVAREVRLHLVPAGPSPTVMPSSHLVSVEPSDSR